MEFQEVIRLKPDHARAHYSLGVSLYLSGRGPEAVPHFFKAMQYEPKNMLIVGNSHYFLGVILTGMPGREAEGRAQLDTAEKLVPNLFKRQ